MKTKIISFIAFPLFVCAAAYAQGITWTPANPMNDARFEDFIAVLLPGHRVLVAGGIGSDFLSLSSAEIYDETTNTWTRTGSMNVARQEFAGNPVVLGDGRVLAIGGITDEFVP